MFLINIVLSSETILPEFILLAFLCNICLFFVSSYTKAMHGSQWVRDRRQISLVILSKLKRINFYFPWNHHTTIHFLMISGGDKSRFICLNSLNVRSKIARRSLSTDPRRNVFCFTENTLLQRLISHFQAYVTSVKIFSLFDFDCQGEINSAYNNKRVLSLTLVGILVLRLHVPDNYVVRLLFIDYIHMPLVFTR